MNPSESHAVCKRHGLRTEYNTVLEQEIAPVLAKLETKISDLEEMNRLERIHAGEAFRERDVLTAELAAKDDAMRQRDERIEALQVEVTGWNEAWSDRGATLQTFLAELTEQRNILYEINIWLAANPEWDLHLEPEWYKRLYEALKDDPAACDEYAEIRKE